MLSWLPTEVVENITNDQLVDSVMAVVNTEAIAVGGVRKSFESCGEAFLCLKEPQAFAYPALFVQMRGVWERYVKDYRRLSMIVNILNPKAIRFAYWLGCDPECVMRQIGPNGDDFVQFVRFNDA